MSEEKDSKKKPEENQTPAGTPAASPAAQPPVETHVKIDVKNETLEQVLKRLTEEESKRKEAEKKLTTATAAKTKAEKDLEEKTTESEGYKSKLTLIAEKKFEEKKTAIEKRAKEIIKDEERLKAVLGKFDDPEKPMKERIRQLQATEFMLETLAGALETGQAAVDKAIEKSKTELLEKYPDAKDKIEAAKDMTELDALTKELTPSTEGKGGKGTVSLASQNAGGAEKEGGYESYEAMVRDLRRREHSDNPEEAAEAKEILDTMFKKWAVAVKKNYEGKLTGGLAIEPEKQPSLKELTGLKEQKEKLKQRRKRD